MTLEIGELELTALPSVVLLPDSLCEKIITAAGKKQQTGIFTSFFFFFVF